MCIRPSSSSDRETCAIRRVTEALKTFWGYNSFRPMQQEAMQSVLEGRDSLVVLPTGGGKSLCFQAPAVVMPGTAVVVSPLISLMKDQVDALTENGVPAARLDSTLNEMEYAEVMDSLRAGVLKLLYVSPERMMMRGFLTMLRGLEVSFVAIDESHCVSMWGHDFRPEYRRLGDLKDALPGTALHGYTATATPHVQGDIVAQLRLEDPEVLVGSFDRPNLTYRVLQRKNEYNQVEDIVQRHDGESGIVYCIRRNDASGMATELKRRGYRALAYHAGMDSSERKSHQDAFINDEVDIVCATVAFGMGIDKPDVRFVAHTGMPKSIEHYQQESGRAGRDGLPAECVLLYGRGDFGTWRSILGGDGNSEASRIALDKLGHMYGFCTGAACRHKALLNYFGQDHPGRCNACDVCLGELDVMENAGELAQMILSCVARLKGPGGVSYGADYTAQVLVASRAERVLSSGHDKLSTYGLLEDYTKGEARDWIEQLVGQDCLARMMPHNTLALTEHGASVMKGDESVRLLKPVRRAETKTPTRTTSREGPEWEGVDAGLFEHLRQVRLELAQAKGVPAYVIFNDVTLRDMCRRLPATPAEFLEVKGVGKKKKRRYAERFLSALRDYCEDHGIEISPGGSLFAPDEDDEDETSPAHKPRLRAYEMFESGADLREVAEEIGRSTGRTATYLADYIRLNDLEAAGPWVDEETLSRVEQAVREGGSRRTRSLQKSLRGEVPREQVKICLALLDNRR